MIPNDIPKYRKKSKNKAPMKSKHKHLIEPCVIAYDVEWWTKEHLRTKNKTMLISGYCPICGKIGQLKDTSTWYVKDNGILNNVQWTETVLTEEGTKQMNSQTRTLPYFEIDDPFDKFVPINSEE